MKNFMVIDGAGNSIHAVFSVDEATFEIVFPGDTDIAFLDEVIERINTLGLDEAVFFGKLYANRMDKRNLQGLHGTLHSTGSYCRKEHFPTRKESDIVND